MVTVESFSLADSGLKPDHKAVIRIGVSNHQLKVFRISHIDSESFMTIVHAISARRAVLDTNPENEIARKIRKIKIPHKSDFLHHRRGFDKAYYAAIKINYLIQEALDPSDKTLS